MIASRSVRTRAMSALGLAMVSLSIGCGMSPAYAPEPQTPAGYVGETPAPTVGDAPVGDDEASSDEIAIGAEDSEYSDADPSALTEFRPALEGHGEWVEDSTYGTVWVPSEAEVGADFVPYTTAGHWTYNESTSYVWVSDYSWGWAPFHYGRWVHGGRRGWVWIPGRAYSGAWVVWRTGDPGYGYVGWAPAMPDWYWYNGYALGWPFGHRHYYSYCPHERLYDTTFAHHVVRGSDPRGREHEARTRPYVAAHPTVDVGRVAAKPTVGRTPAKPRVGPRPSELGIRSELVVAPPVGHAGLTRATTLASARTAVAAGAAAPAQALRASRRVVLAQPFGSRPPLTSRVDAVARAPQVQGVRPVPPRQLAVVDPRPVPQPAPMMFGTSPGTSAAIPQPTFRSSAPSVSQPSISQPTFRSSTPSVSQPTFRSSTPSVSQPTFRSSTPSVSQPTFRSSAPSVSQPTFRSSAPSVRSSTPSQPTFRASTPSRAAAPSVVRPSSPSRPAAPTVRRGR